MAIHNVVCGVMLSVPPSVSRHREDGRIWRRGGKGEFEAEAEDGNVDGDGLIYKRPCLAV